MLLFRLVVGLLRSLLLPRFALLLENVALRHQFAALQRSFKRPRLRQSDRILRAWVSRLWPDWRSCLVSARPQIVNCLSPVSSWSSGRHFQ